jgi:hypothetical protein
VALDRSNTDVVGSNPLFFLCSDVLCRYRSSDGTICRPDSPIKMSERVNNFRN